MMTMIRPDIQADVDALPHTWRRAVDRALNDALDCVQVNPQMFAVPSVSSPGKLHRVMLDANNRIESCDCPGFRGRRQPCKHAGRVGLALLEQRAGARLVQRASGTYGYLTKTG